MKISWHMDADTAGVAALVAADAAAFLSGVNPSLFTMRAFRSEGGEKAETTKTDIRIGSAIGGLLAIIVGIGATLITKSWWPLVVTVLVLAVMIGSYEWAIANPHNRGGDIATQ